MIQSMTGYGRAIAELSGKNVIVEVKSLNSKQLDLNSRLITLYRDKDLEVRDYVSSKLIRGKIEIAVFTETKEGSLERNLQESVVKAYYEKIMKVATDLNAQNFSAMDIVMRMPDIWTTETQQFASEDEWVKVKEALVAAVENILSYRKKEGEALYRDLRGNIQIIVDLLAKIEEYEKLRIGKIRNKIENGLAELIASDKIDKNRLEQEMIFYLEKLDINEEKVRLAQHCKYFIDTMDNEPYAGKKLNFIAQEIGREINTMGSKSNDSDMQRIVVEMKDNLEKIKEQVLNIL